MPVSATIISKIFLLSDTTLREVISILPFGVYFTALLIRLVKISSISFLSDFINALSKSRLVLIVVLLFLDVCKYRDVSSSRTAFTLTSVVSGSYLSNSKRVIFNILFNVSVRRLDDFKICSA